LGFCCVVFTQFLWPLGKPSLLIRDECLFSFRILLIDPPCRSLYRVLAERLPKSFHAAACFQRRPSLLIRLLVLCTWSCRYFSDTRHFTPITSGSSCWLKSPLCMPSLRDISLSRPRKLHGPLLRDDTASPDNCRQFSIYFLNYRVRAYDLRPRIPITDRTLDPLCRSVRLYF